MAYGWPVMPLNVASTRPRSNTRRHRMVRLGFVAALLTPLNHRRSSSLDETTIGLLDDEDGDLAVGVLLVLGIVGERRNG